MLKLLINSRPPLILPLKRVSRPVILVVLATSLFYFYFLFMHMSQQAYELTWLARPITETAVIEFIIYTLDVCIPYSIHTSNMWHVVTAACQAATLCP